MAFVSKISKNVFDDKLPDQGSVFTCAEIVQQV